MGACQSRLGEASISGTNKQCSEQGYAKIKTSPTEKIRSKAIQKFKPFRLFSHSKTQIMGARQSRLGEASISGTNNVPSKAMKKLKPFQMKKDREQGYVTIKTHSKTQIMGANYSRLGEAATSGTHKQCSEQGYAKL